jgi:hypothetical protein
MGGCCIPYEEKLEARPPYVQGWKEVTIENNVRLIGQHVLNKGESTDNGKLGVKLVDISPPVTCQGLYLWKPPARKAKLQFFQPKNNEILCETTVTEGNSVLKCGGRVGVYMIGVNAINNKEGWIWFDLRE